MAKTATDRALEMARRALAILEEQAVGFGALHVPAHLQIELEEKRREVVKLEARLKTIDARPAVSTVFDQRGQQVGMQVNVAGNVTGPVLSGKFAGPVAVGGGEAVDLRDSQGAVYKPSAPPETASSAITPAALRHRLQRLDSVEIAMLCLDHFPIVYDKFGRGLRRDEMINLLLDYCRRNPEAAQRLVALLEEA